MTTTALLTTAEAAAVLSLAPKTLYNWRALGVGPADIRVGGRVRYREADVAEWISNHAVEVGA